ncbi:hypothetical protein PLICRDRAFT_32884 [Plicaturopsis crispa FD-325 SS-3]|uniref:Uncharacterized protein n=1 Tax=Plicaturopsis crispa FD-325 SS-3 TaxID=944288 RepID=A0A0C9SKD7_PLICR|nr:hypothetical protein PLICRDRAFT_32884 [Plicaturopsis crispa FD-325 SS-3]
MIMVTTSSFGTLKPPAAMLVYPSRFPDIPTATFPDQDWLGYTEEMQEFGLPLSEFSATMTSRVLGRKTSDPGCEWRLRPKVQILLGRDVDNPRPATIRSEDNAALQEMAFLLEIVPQRPSVVNVISGRPVSPFLMRASVYRRARELIIRIVLSAPRGPMVVLERVLENTSYIVSSFYIRNGLLGPIDTGLLTETILLAKTESPRVAPRKLSTSTIELLQLLASTSKNQGNPFPLTRVYSLC